MNARKLMARLNASTVKFDVGSGGIPEFTPQDIAAAVGMVSDELAREVFAAIWWPDGARLTRDRLLEMVGARQAQQLERQWRAVQVARLELHLAEDNAAGRVHLSPLDRVQLEGARARVAMARALCWPATAPMYRVVRVAVLDELAEANRCPTCAGRGEVRGLVTSKCATCDGSGIVPVSDRQRAERIGRDESTYRAKWRGLYEWTYTLLAGAEQTGAAAVSRALSGCGSDTPALSE